MIQDAWDWCIGMTQRDGMGREVGGGFRMGNTCTPVADSFAIIFSHSEGCLFTLLIVSFVVQKLLSLIRSHLFIFAFISNILGGGS